MDNNVIQKQILTLKKELDELESTSNPLYESLKPNYDWMINRLETKMSGFKIPIPPFPNLKLEEIKDMHGKTVKEGDTIRITLFDGVDRYVCKVEKDMNEYYKPYTLPWLEFEIINPEDIKPRDKYGNIVNEGDRIKFDKVKAINDVIVVVHTNEWGQYEPYIMNSHKFEKIK